jgi:hypothetical protein
MKKVLNYYLPVALYCAFLFFVFLSLIFVERTPETENAIVEYQPAILHFISCYILLPLLGFSYFMYFFDTLFNKVDVFFLKRYLKKCDLPESCLQTEDKGDIFKFISAVSLLIAAIANFFI